MNLRTILLAGLFIFVQTPGLVSQSPADGSATVKEFQIDQQKSSDRVSDHLCSTEKVNRSCKLIIDRANLLQPPTLQMYPDAVVAVFIKNGYQIESPSLDWQSSTATAAPDPIAAVFTTFNATFAKIAAVTQLHGKALLPKTNPQTSGDACEKLNDPNPQRAYDCAIQIAADAQRAMPKYSILMNPDVVTPASQKYEEANFTMFRTDAICSVLGKGAKKLDDSLICNPEKYHDQVADQAKLAAWVTKYTKDKPDADITELSTITNGLVTALAGFAENLIELKGRTAFDGSLGIIIDPARKNKPSGTLPSCNASTNILPDSKVRNNLVQRTVTCALNVVNLVANSSATVPSSSLKKTLISISVNYADTRLETSAGVLLSALPSRSFAATSYYSGNPPTVNSIVARENDTRPLVVPFAALNVLLHDGLCGARRCGFYGTVLAGVNPNTTTADFGAGLSVSWRSLMISPVAHFAHDVKLTNGISVNEPVGTSFSGTLPTQQFWTTSWGIGVSYRIPMVPGR